MQYAQCKCGNYGSWSTGERHYDCQGCEKCQTTVAQGPDGHKPLQPHKWVQKYSTDTGLPSYMHCSDCMARKKDPA